LFANIIVIGSEGLYNIGIHFAGQTNEKLPLLFMTQELIKGLRALQRVACHMGTDGTILQA
jgi:hypothetical protein